MSTYNPTYRERWLIVRDELTKQERDTEFQLQQRLVAEETLRRVRVLAERWQMYPAYRRGPVAAEILNILDGKKETE